MSQINQKSSLNSWLETNISGTDSPFSDWFLSTDQLELLPHNSGLEFKDVYCNDSSDPDILNNPTEMIKRISLPLDSDDDIEEKKYDVEEYSERNILLRCLEVYPDNSCVLVYPSINRAHANYLFKCMVSAQKKHKTLMVITIPEIIYSSNKTKISFATSTHSMINPKQKKKFYEFCFDNTYSRRFVAAPIRPPIPLTKQSLGKLELAKTLKKVEDAKKHNEDLENSKPFELLPYEKTVEFLGDLNREYDKYISYLEIFWIEVFYKYLSDNNCNNVLLDRLNSGLRGSSAIIAFFNSLPLYEKMEKLIHRLEITLERHKVEYRKKKIEDSENKLASSTGQPKKIDTTKLFGSL